MLNKGWIQSSVRAGLLRPVRKAGLAVARHWPWPVAAKLNTGRQMYVDLRSALGRAIFIKGEFDPMVFRPLGERLKPGGVFIDVGANAGYYSMRALDFINEIGAVHAFEIDPRPLRCLRKTIQTFGIHNMNLHATAIGDANGTGHLVTRADSGYTNVHSGGGGQTVEMTRLDSWRERHPQGRVQAIKLDIEGGELAALRGAVRLLRQEHPLLVCEVIEECDGRRFSEPKKIFELLDALSYRWRWLEGTCDPTIVAE